MVIIEFCGNPGCGKSTLCDELEMCLRDAGYKVKNLQKRQKCDTLSKKINKVIRIIHYKLYSENRHLKKTLYSIQRNKVWADRIMEVKWLVDQHLDYDYLLFDEGCIQFLSSLVENYDEDIIQVLDLINREFYNYQTILFSCHVFLDENVKRLKCRNKPGDRFVKENDELIKQKLEQKTEILNAILAFPWDMIDTYNIDTSGKDEALKACLSRVQ